MTAYASLARLMQTLPEQCTLVLINEDKREKKVSTLEAGCKEKRVSSHVLLQVGIWCIFAA